MLRTLGKLDILGSNRLTHALILLSSALSYYPSGYMVGRIILEYNPHRTKLKLELCLEAAVGINSFCKNLCQSLLLAFQVMFSIHKIQFPVYALPN